MRPAVLGGAAVALVAVVLLLSSVFAVRQTEQVLITQFGSPVRQITDPGLQFKLPFVQSAITFDRRLLDYDFPPEEVILGDQRRLIVDSFIRYRITDMLRHYQAVGPSEYGLQARLQPIVLSAVRNVLGREQLLNVLSSQRARIMEDIRKRVADDTTAFGVEIDDLRIRRADLPAENTQAILSRMKSERQRVAAQSRAEGAEAAARVRADAELQRTVILANARATAETLRGQGEAQAIAVYADAYQRDPAFFKTWRTLQAYRDGFAGGGGRLVMTPSADFLRLLREAPTVSAAPAPAAPATPPPQ